MSDVAPQKKWIEVITPTHNIFSLNFRELWNYRDLLFILIRRDILAIYKQTIFGPLWFFLQPVLTTVTYVIIFSRVGKLSTSGLPPVIFYLSGLVLWSYFSECILRTATFFKDNSQVLTKVYFPRLIVPISIVLTNLVKFAIQFALFLSVYCYFLIRSTAIHPNIFLLLLPVLILMVAGLGLGIGMIVSSLSTKYKDLIHLISFGIQLLMFTSPVIFPLSGFDQSKYRLLIMANPMTGIIEAFRYGFLGTGYFSWGLLAYDAAFVLVFILLGVVIFNSIERNFADSI